MNNNERKYKTQATLQYNGKDYAFLYDYEYEEKDAGSVYFNWTEGNFSCDCNRADFIARFCDEDFPELECGSTIKLTSLKSIEVGAVDGNISAKELLS